MNELHINRYLLTELERAEQRREMLEAGFEPVEPGEPPRWLRDRLAESYHHRCQVRQARRMGLRLSLCQGAGGVALGLWMAHVVLQGVGLA